MRGANRRPLPDGKPRHEAGGHTHRHGGDARGDRHTKSHEQRARRNNEHEAHDSGDAPGQHEHQSTDHGHCACCTRGDHTTFASQLAAAGNDAIGYRHVRNVIRRGLTKASLSVGALGSFRSLTPMLVLLALCGAIAARIGGELAVRWPLLFAGDLNAAPVVWWLAVAASVAGAATAVLQHRPAGRWFVVVVVVFAGHGAAQWHRLATPQVGNFSGTAIARSDAGNRNGAVSLIVSVDDEKFRLTVYGRERGALRRVRMGDTVILDAQRVAYDARRLRFVAGRHVQGELREVTVYATAPAHTLWHRAANRVHELIDRGARTMHWQDAALVRGFVLGDESRHPQRMTEAFRGAGLGHLLAVSGQNVALILAALTPGLRRLSRWPRLAVALGVVSMFAVVTRLESSVVRAAVMAAVVQIGFAIGRDVVPLRALAMTVLGIVGLDPLAMWSVGFVLSVAATMGLVVITPHLGSSVFASTTAAQLGVSPFVLMWFGAMPVVALGANVLAVPVASGVMMTAPVLLAIAAFVPDAVAAVLVVPVVAAVRWVWWVAEWGTRLSVRGPLNALAWGFVVVGVLIRKAVRRRHLH